MGIWEVFGYFLKNIQYIIKLDLQEYCGYFQVCVKNAPWGPNSGPFLDPHMMQR